MCMNLHVCTFGPLSSPAVYRAEHLSSPAISRAAKGLFAVLVRGASVIRTAKQQKPGHRYHHGLPMAY